MCVDDTLLGLQWNYSNVCYQRKPVVVDAPHNLRESGEDARAFV